MSLPSKPRIPDSDESSKLSRASSSSSFSTSTSTSTRSEANVSKNSTLTPRSNARSQSLETIATPPTPAGLPSDAEIISDGAVPSKENESSIDLDRTNLSALHSGDGKLFEKSVGFAPKHELLEDMPKVQPHAQSMISQLQNNIPTFFDGQRSVDFVLVWDLHNYRACTEDAVRRRQIFEENLSKVGLQLEYEDTERNGLSFVKVHAPLEVLRRYCEILKLRMPMRE